MKQYEKWLTEITNIPTAAGKEERVVAWIKNWSRKEQGISLEQDRFGNLVLSQKRNSSKKPIFITAHLDHPAFVVRRQIDENCLEMEFRGGVQDPYFIGSQVEVFDNKDNRYIGTIETLDSRAKPFKRVTVRLKKSVAGILIPGDIARWNLNPSVIKAGLLHAPACDDLAGVAAAISALNKIKKIAGLGHVGVLLTRAEEIGFVGAIAAAKYQTIPKKSRLLCLETSRSFPESPIGDGPILRVGDKTSVFGPELTNAIANIMAKQKKIIWQRKLMPGGTCESTAFCSYGYLSTCLCLALGNYHNMKNIDGVLKKKKSAKVASEIISVSDYHGLINMLTLVCKNLDKTGIHAIHDSLEVRLEKYKYVLD